MTAAADGTALLAELDRAVQEALAYFAGPGRGSTARVDQWQARDVLMHFLYFHDATAWGLQSVALGGPPWPVPADTDLVNEVCRRLHAHESLDELLAQLRQAHARLTRAVGAAVDLDQACFRRASGETMSGRQRLQLLVRHWAGHLRELQEAEAKTGAR
jgi:hypothetical protein